MATDLSLNDLRAPARLPSASTLQTLNKVLLVMLVLIAAAALYAGFVFFKVQSKLDAERRENAANAAVVATAVNDLQVIQKQFEGGVKEAGVLGLQNEIVIGAGFKQPDHLAAAHPLAQTMLD